MLSILNVRANNHNSCEDSVFVDDANEDVIYGVIADGCSTGIKSHFASQVIAYFVQLQQESDVTSDSFVMALYEFLYEVKGLFKFSEMNLLSTCILFSYHKPSKSLRIRSFGDCVYYVHDREIIVDQNNKPDYMGYHIGDTYSQFEAYMEKYPMSEYTNVERFMICSDGIKGIDRGMLQPPQTTNQAILFYPPTSTNYHIRMWNKLKRDGFTLSDDLTIVSYAEDSKTE